MNRALALAVAAAAAVLAAAPAAPAANPTETVVFEPVAGSAVRGTATLGANGVGTKVRVDLRGLPSRATVRVLLRTGRWPDVSASFAVAVTPRADAAGSARARSAVRYRGEPVSWTLVADGDHLLTVVVAGRVVATAAIPGMS